ncbi:type III secretion system inner membrane ring lipoprotein SctJ [Kozakia baliensis]|uniref:type III secretion system inner membrane ring lipoprotein SctJ n=1 Tax=Kozakia baliensis TaxID=153496 RepID=UPI00087DD231|nr:type III secretion inner membrane ring lipoprotein SctJ [Kozakia baliensis]AOX20006.1 hypothetical protein A0U90_06560 [Kozakia baliensis]
MARFIAHSIKIIPLVLLLSLTACQTQLYTELSERDAMEMIAILLQHGISADRVISKDGTSTVEVPNGRVADAVAVLRTSHYPRNEYESMEKIFQQQGMISTPTAERAKLYFGISQELDHTLNDIDGVIDARVHIAPAANDPITGTDKPASASVVIRYDAGSSMDGLLPKIKLMVANAVQDLAYDRVSVILLPVQTPHLAPVQPSGLVGPLGFVGWAFAIFWPAAYGGWRYWQHRKKKPAASGTSVSVIPERAA